MIEDVDLIVVGSGQGGDPLAAEAARCGKRVVLFEREHIGGTCVNVGCTPSKAFLASAHSAGRARLAGPLGVTAHVSVDQRFVMNRVRAVVHEWRSGLEEKFARLGVDVIRARGAFVGERTVAGGGRTIRAPHVVIDVGGHAVVPEIDGLAGTPCMTNESFFDQEVLPERAIVIGGGYIGLELGQGMQRCGTAVTIVHNHDRLLEREEADAGAILLEALRDDGMAVELSAKPARVAYANGVFTVTLADSRTLVAEGLLVATGRRPNTADLGVERGGIALDARGNIVVNDALETASPGVYALGDAAGQPAFTHVAWEDYRRVTSAMNGHPRRRDDRVLSYTTFTEPQLARTGLDADQAKARGYDVRVATLPLADVARGAEWNLERGFFRLVADAANDRILGATFIGYEAGELIHIIAALIERASTWRELEAMMFVHPTFAEGLPSLARLLEPAPMPCPPSPAMYSAPAAG